MWMFTFKSLLNCRDGSCLRAQKYFMDIRVIFSSGMCDLMSICIYCKHEETGVYVHVRACTYVIPDTLPASSSTLQKGLVCSQNSNSLSDSCFLFCEPVPFGSRGVIPNTGPAGGFPLKNEEGGNKPSADISARKKKSTDGASLAQMSAYVSFT